MTFQLRKGEFSAGLFSTITTLGTPLDVTLQEIRLENGWLINTLFPGSRTSLTL